MKSAVDGRYPVEVAGGLMPMENRREDGLTMELIQANETNRQEEGILS